MCPTFTLYQKAILIAFGVPLLLYAESSFGSRKLSYEFKKNVLYGKDSSQQVLDYYLPAGRNAKTTPVIILIHGGAWIAGDKNDFDDLGVDTTFTNIGYAAVNMNYRLCEKAGFPAQINDIQAVIKYLRENARKLHVNASRICLLGRSAGAQLALLYAYSRNTKKSVKAVIACCPPTNFIDSSVTNGPLSINVSHWLGDYATHVQLWKEASPIFYVKGAIPTVILHGALDNLVYPVQTNMLRDSLYQAGVPQLFISWPNTGHGWNIPRWPYDSGPVLKWVRNFLEP